MPRFRAAKIRLGVFRTLYHRLNPPGRGLRHTHGRLPVHRLLLTRDIRFGGQVHNNKMQRMNDEVRDREKVMRGLKRMDTPILKGVQIYHNFIKPHMALEGQTPAHVAGIGVDSKNKWMGLLKRTVDSGSAQLVDNSFILTLITGLGVGSIVGAYFTEFFRRQTRTQIAESKEKEIRFRSVAIYMQVLLYPDQISHLPVDVLKTYNLTTRADIEQTLFAEYSRMVLFAPGTQP